jgi:hypothetical protein
VSFSLGPVIASAILRVGPIVRFFIEGDQASESPRASSAGGLIAR